MAGICEPVKSQEGLTPFDRAIEVQTASTPSVMPSVDDMGPADRRRRRFGDADVADLPFLGRTSVLLDYVEVGIAAL